ncbi:hypothetical protein LMG26858_03206 [Achromobacter anxifer]|jgi:hypothetical protein|uniref:DUF7661 domain-containing protein n=1 Tax=Achromobacter anxifer TaxID=1287737 RepID=A0A6S7DRN5_9BURK|nr:hypothetical protein [Achromobacter anxifer]CAB3880581.1 hypothetical protein LMG26858_03206 [Achromobacter anxifer]CAB5512461.1 hypothetical protein LMG26857_01751 [Achromobacter anxifer]
MRFDIYGRFQLDIQREGAAWAVYRSEGGKRVRVSDLAIPADVSGDELAEYLDDIYHEASGPGDRVARID